MASRLIVIPARYGSTRLPGKPLAIIAGRTMLERVVAVGMAAANRAGADLAVATDDQRIEEAARALGVPAAMTDPEISSGSGRALAAARALGDRHEIIANLQGDAPFADPDHVAASLSALAEGDWDVATPVVRLDWAALDAFRQQKLATPASGTTAIADASGRALWFSKTVLPFMRHEKKLREGSDLSPVLRHVGIYAFRWSALERFEGTPSTRAETLEGLEQLRMLETGLKVRVVEVPQAHIESSGIDSAEDIARAEALIAAHGDPFIDWRQT